MREFKLKHHVRVVTAASLFDGHDAAINIMRRILQANGAEVIHLGHNRSVAEIVDCAVQEDAQAIALTSYQGGHVEYLKYMYDLINQRNAKIKIFAGGGGTILPEEIAELEAYGIEKIYSPDDGRAMGLEGMIRDVLERSDFAPMTAKVETLIERVSVEDHKSLARLITAVEADETIAQSVLRSLEKDRKPQMPPVLGITGTGGAGKSSLVDEVVRRFLLEFTDKSVAIISIDPSKRKTGGALLGDRIRMNSIHDPRVYMRSIATRQSNLAMSKNIKTSIEICRHAGFDLVIVETSGIGQSDTEIVEHSDVALYVMTPDYGAATQLEKIDMLDYADIIAINKFDKRGSLDALRDVKKQYKRNHQMFEAGDDEVPVYGTQASQFNDGGTNVFYAALIDVVVRKTGHDFGAPSGQLSSGQEKAYIIPPERTRYLAEIVETNAREEQGHRLQIELARKLYAIAGSLDVLYESRYQSLLGEITEEHATGDLGAKYRELYSALDPKYREMLRRWPKLCDDYRSEQLSYKVREREIKVELTSRSLSGLNIPKVALPRFRDWGDILQWLLKENVPGSFPYTAGVFPFKRQGEDPARMFAGEGGPERTNKRFHYVSAGMPAKRLSTAFDSVTLYGEDPDARPDIYGKIGNSGVSVATIDDAKKLYSGFDLTSEKTSVSMTINGPAPTVLAFFINAAIDQECEKHIRETGAMDAVQRSIEERYNKNGVDRPRYNGQLPDGSDELGLALLGVSGDDVLAPEVYERIKAATLPRIRGTVQADILKEDQAQNTCIFSTEFALMMLGDVQQYFVDHKVRNFYSISISGYHIAEAGANPITQLALTLSNGFTYVEYYLSRGMHIDDFAPNLSFFFSNGLDPEYSVIGRVARRIWARAIKYKYGGNERSQRLKYHIQTSGRSLHAQEIAFNDIRTTLQALYALFDNCNSLHTNAYDEAITTPTEESVRRAMAIQLIINKELGLSKNENPLQGSFAVEQLTDMVEQAVLAEFNRISERGGVLGAMETMYQRTKIQEESMYYEHRKHTGEIPIVGVNTFLDSKGSPTLIPEEVIRATKEEKEFAISSLKAFQQRNLDSAPAALVRLQQSALDKDNLFSVLMEVSKVCSLGQISQALYDVGGKYRRNM